MRLSIAYCLILILVAVILPGCQGNPPPPPGTAGSALTGAEQVSQVNLTGPDGQVPVSLWRTDTRLMIRAVDGRSIQLEHSTSWYTPLTLELIPAPTGQHLLVTVDHTRAWVLIPEAQGFRVALDLKADEEILLVGDVIRLRERQYEIPGGYWLRSRDCRLDQQAGSYKCVTAEARPPKAELTKGRDGVMDAVWELPDLVEYRARLKARGYSMVAQYSETPSWHHVRIGENQPQKVTWTRTYMIRKADGLVLAWDIAKGGPPQD